MAPIHGCHSMSCGDYKLHSFLQLSGQSMVVVEGTLMECEFLPFFKDAHTLLCLGVVPQEMFEILYFMAGNPLHHNFEYGIFLLHSYPVCHMQVYTHVSGLCLDCNLFNLLMYPFISLSHHWFMGISPSCSPYGNPSRMDFTASAFSFDTTWLRASATTLSLLFWYSMLNVNPAGDSTQWCHVASKLRVVRM